jgi:hypothetical protein
VINIEKGHKKTQGVLVAVDYSLNGSLSKGGRVSEARSRRGDRRCRRVLNEVEMDDVRSSMRMLQ